jgi:cell wall-associated NlpC family hydrolase
VDETMKLCFFVILFFLSACTTHHYPTQKNLFSETPIADIKNLPQTGNIISNNNLVTPPEKKKSFKDYTKIYFSPWTKQKINIDKKTLSNYFNPKKKKYGENFAVLPDSWYSQLKENANIPELGKLKRTAIIVANSSLRHIPTMKPAYYDPNKAGEGYPFDSLQEGLLRVGEPVLLSHFTKDGSFAFIETNKKTRGFVETKNLAIVDEKLAKTLLNSKFIMIMEDDVQTLKFGTFLPINKLPFRDENGMARLKNISIDKSKFIVAPLALTSKNVTRVISALINKPYGWGGYLNNRDCAQLVKDYFAAFGIHMPIFSGEQIKVGQPISLSGLDKQAKLEKIKAEAKPFRTLLYRKGHLGIYLGEYNNQPIMFHSIWGVRLYDGDTEYRHIIGKSAITTLEYGKELKGYDNKKSNFLESLSRMTVIPVANGF